jgi:phosphatidate cytidylyltransferase
MGQVAGIPLGTGMEHMRTSRVTGLGKRILSTIVLLPAFLWILIAAPPWLYAGVIVLIAARGHWELTGMFGHIGTPTLRLAGLIGGAVVTASFAVPGLEVPALTAVVLGLLTASLYRSTSQSVAWEPIAITVLGIGYVNWLLGYGIWLRALDGGIEWVLLLVWVTWLGETAAYVVGSLVGRRKLAPIVSPRKTVEGALAQLVVSILAALAAQASFVSVLRPGQAIVIGAVLGVVGQIGDLTESALKRSVGTKDSGQLIPGHGGILDRVDGLLFNAPVLFYCAAWTRTLSS